MYRVEIGSFVNDRLARTSGVFKVPATGLDLFVLRDFLSAEECSRLMTLIDIGRQPSTVLATKHDPEFRTSESCNLSPHDPFIQGIEARITALMGIDATHGETIQGQRYAVGQQFKPHHDFFHVDQPYWQVQEKIGGQRTWTTMMFLNEPEAGGQTYFPETRVRITPRTGNLLTWNNMDAAGEPNGKSIHQGMPVDAGVKYVITKWYRERKWG